MNIIQAIADKNLFGGLFKDPATWTAWRTFLKAGFALPMNAGELEIFKQFTGRAAAPARPVHEAFCIAGRRSGKSFTCALIACYLALFKNWAPYLAAGEEAWIMVIAADRRQAKVVLNYCKGILGLKMFRSKVQKELSEEIELSNRIRISVKTCDFRTIRGFTCAAAICDEVAFWRSGDSANPAEEILSALRPALATIPDSLLIGISSPYSRTGPLYEAFRTGYGQDSEDTLVWRAPTKAMNPTIQDSVIERALRDDYAAARAEWLAEFREDLETFLSTEVIERAIIPNRFELPRIDGTSYRCFVDPSGGRVDSFTMAIAHRETEGRIVLDRLEDRRPPFGPADIAAEFSSIMKEYGVSSCRGDKYAGEWVRKAFDDAGISYKASDLNKSEIYLEFEPLMAQGRVDLLDLKRLQNELRGLERRTRSGGRDQVDHFPGGHDDCSNAAAGACVLADKDSGGGGRMVML